MHPLLAGAQRRVNQSAGPRDHQRVAMLDRSQSHAVGREFGRTVEHEHDFKLATLHPQTLAARHKNHPLLDEVKRRFQRLHEIERFSHKSYARRGFGPAFGRQPALNQRTNPPETQIRNDDHLP